MTRALPCSSDQHQWDHKTRPIKTGDKEAHTKRRGIDPASLLHRLKHRHQQEGHDEGEQDVCKLYLLSGDFEKALSLEGFGSYWEESRDA